MNSLINIYALIGRMRVLSSTAVVDNAEQIAQKIIDTYLQPNKSFLELRDMVQHQSIDILGRFSEACREEFELLRAQQF